MRFKINTEKEEDAFKKISLINEDSKKEYFSINFLKNDRIHSFSIKNKEKDLNFDILEHIISETKKRETRRGDSVDDELIRYQIVEEFSEDNKLLRKKDKRIEMGLPVTESITDNFYDSEGLKAASVKKYKDNRKEFSFYFGDERLVIGIQPDLRIEVNEKNEIYYINLKINNENIKIFIEDNEIQSVKISEENIDDQILNETKTFNKDGVLIERQIKRIDQENNKIIQETFNDNNEILEKLVSFIDSPHTIRERHLSKNNNEPAKTEFFLYSDDQDKDDAEYIIETYYDDNSLYSREKFDDNRNIIKEEIYDVSGNLYEMSEYYYRETTRKEFISGDIPLDKERHTKKTTKFWENGHQKEVSYYTEMDNYTKPKRVEHFNTDGQKENILKVIGNKILKTLVNDNKEENEIKNQLLKIKEKKNKNKKQHNQI